MPSTTEHVPSNRRERRHPETGRRRWATLEQSAGYLGVTSRTIRQMIADGRLTGYRNGSRIIRVDLNEIDDKLMQPFGGAA
ncbi:excisionase family DNA-binding protein [Mycolicibacterium sphagni]|uniref:excisionase family DNA-binding protein n=1 Tax=Mycolicibacterium sphagni TaxID=1786 RepID=UPI0021F2DA04|nr:excisionase family DNA-binding protein [Mycolicibacterium sphagni]MCV7176160.1 excisionase family DNA-binding protein [Mycolicibacterium sphagni]